MEWGERQPSSIFRVESVQQGNVQFKESRDDRFGSDYLGRHFKLCKNHEMTIYE